MNKKELKEYFMRKILLPFIYRVGSLLPVKNDLVVFADERRNELPHSMQLVHDKMVDMGKDVCLYLKDTRYDTYVNILLQNAKFMFTFARAKNVFVIDYYEPLYCCKKRNDTTVVQLWHGCGAFKKWGYSTLDDKFGMTREQVAKFPTHINYDYVTVSSEEVRKHYAEAFNMNIDKIKATGVSRTDVYFDKDFLAKAKEEFYEKYPQAKGKKIILYAPTFRGSVKNPRTPNYMKYKFAYPHLKQDHIILYKMHPFMKEKFHIEDGFDDFAFDVSNMPIEKLLPITDILVTDYSSLIFEYALFEKPIIFMTYDYDNYLTWRGFFYEYTSFVPSVMVKNNPELVYYIKTIDRWFNKQHIIDFKDKFMDACDGNSTDRILKLIEGE